MEIFVLRSHEPKNRKICLSVCIVVLWVPKASKITKNNWRNLVRFYSKPVLWVKIEARKVKVLKKYNPILAKNLNLFKSLLKLGGYPFLSNTLQPQQLDRFFIKCLLHRVVYETAYRDVSEREPSYHCCPGWTQQPKASHGCTTRKYSSI